MYCEIIFIYLYLLFIQLVIYLFIFKLNYERRNSQTLLSSHGKKFILPDLQHFFFLFALEDQLFLGHNYLLVSATFSFCFLSVFKFHEKKKITAPLCNVVFLLQKLLFISVFLVNTIFIVSSLSGLSTGERCSCFISAICFVLEKLKDSIQSVSIVTVLQKASCEMQLPYSAANTRHVKE